MKNIIIAILCVTNIGFLCFIYMYMKKSLLAFKAFSELQAKMATALELYVVNDNAHNDNLNKGATLDEVMVAIGNASRFWKTFPPHITTLIKGINGWIERRLVIMGSKISTKKP